MKNRQSFLSLEQLFSLCKARKCPQPPLQVTKGVYKLILYIFYASRIRAGTPLARTLKS